jgi:hypothetical protein
MLLTIYFAYGMFLLTKIQYRQEKNNTTMQRKQYKLITSIA